MRVEKKRGERGFRVVAYFPPGSLPDPKATSVCLHRVPTRRDAAATLHDTMGAIAAASVVSVRVSVD